jgi:hypothetical protein
MEVKAMQSAKQVLPIDVTELGIAMEVNFSQFWKQPFLRDVIKSVLNLTFVKSSQLAKQLAPIYVTLFGIVMEANNSQS